ncbi:hybrid sensor histidine kinase/response regulator [Candidatus Marinamargulisbacteria bacterium SCGC AG-439-L15]|nr:hybrid sensor histidine kinase/response regulator [Candidatus Marinamargulisbacteria bacterium SCGC AG-439-L15]
MEKLEKLIKEISHYKGRLEKTDFFKQDKEATVFFSLCDELIQNTQETAFELNDLKLVHDVSVQHNSTIENQLCEEREKINDESKKFEFILNASEDCVSLINEKLAYEAINQSFCDYFMKKREDILGKKVRQIWGVKVFNEFLYPSIKKAFNGQSHFFQFEKEINGNRRYFEVNCYPYSDKKVVSTVVITFKDITERKSLEEQVIRSQRIDSLGKLASGIAHDLNNILSPFFIALKTLGPKLSEDKNSMKILEILNSNAQRAADLVKQILTFSQGVEGEKLNLDLKFIVDEIQGLIKETFPKDIVLVMKVSRKLWSISGDSTQIHQILLNLCLNARDAMPRGGTLLMTLKNKRLNNKLLMGQRVTGDFVELCVEDSGCGMSSTTLSKIFEPFFTTKEFGKGTGIGLSTVMAVVRSHQGFIDVSSMPKKGTTFKVYFPANATDKDVTDRLVDTKVYEGSGETILVIDDEKSLRDVIASTLKTCKYSVLIAENGQEGVYLFQQNKKKIDIILVDIVMPLMDGPQAIDKIKRLNPGVKIIGMTGVVLDDKRQYLEKVKSVVDDFLYKPFTRELLLNTISKTLSKS